MLTFMKLARLSERDPYRLWSFGSEYNNLEERVSILVRFLHSKNALKREHAANGLAYFGRVSLPDIRLPLEEAVRIIQIATPALVKVLRHDKVHAVRSRAARALALCESEPEQAVPALIDAIDESDCVISHWTTYGLGQLGAKAQAAVPRLLRVLDSADPGLLGNSVVALYEILGSEAESTIAAHGGPVPEKLNQAVAELLSNVKNSTWHDLMMHHLTHICVSKSMARLFVSRLVECLSAPEPDAALSALSYLGPSAISAESELTLLAARVESPAQVARVERVLKRVRGLPCRE